MAAYNYAKKFAPKVDERFHKESQASLVTNNSYDFKGVKTVAVYSVPTVPMTDYERSGLARYGSPEDLGNQTQELTITKDRSFTFVIDKGDKEQTQMVMDAGKALSRQLREVCIPEYDAHVFKTIAKAAQTAGNTSATAITKTNAYEQLLAAQEVLGNHCVPDSGRVCLCSYKFANYLKLDSSFMKYGNASQEMVKKGILGEVDGTRIVKVPASRLPAGCDFILTHPSATVAPKQLEDYKIHTDPPGISGYLCEGRMLYDAFVLNNKVNACFYHGTAIG